MIVQTSQTFEASYEAGVSGLLPGLLYAIVDGQGTVVIGPTSLGIIENEVNAVPTGNYTATVPAAPGTPGTYQVLWSPDGSFAPETLSSEDLLVVDSGIAISIPPLLPPDEGGVSTGPCSAWTTTDDILACCTLAGSDADAVFPALVSASQTLYELSGRRWQGVCTYVVRPCGQRQCGFQVLSRGHIIGNWNGWQWEGSPCGCRPLSRVLLPNGPVREITEVKIDGVALDPQYAGGTDQWRVDRGRWLVKLSDPDEQTVSLWPSCQRLDLDGDQEGTFEVTYTAGATVPLAGSQAATELACEIFKSCALEDPSACQLPSGVVRVERQGVTFDLQKFRTWGFSRQGMRWETGLPLVDLFLNTYNPHGLRRRPALWSPDGPKYALRVG